MPDATLNAGRRSDPYAAFPFRVKMDGGYVLGVSKVSGLSQSTQTVTHRAGRDPRTPGLLPGQAQYSPITMQRGVSTDVAFGQWASKVFDWSNTQGRPVGETTSLSDFRKDLTIELTNEAGQVVVAYTVHRAWVTELNALPDLDGVGDALVIELIVFQHEGWSRQDIPGIDDALPPA